MTTVTSSLSSSKVKFIIPSTDTKSTSTSGKKEASSKTKPEFIVRTNYPDSNAPLGVSVSKFNRNHVVVRNRIQTYKLNFILHSNYFIFLVFTSTVINQRWSSC